MARTAVANRYTVKNYPYNLFFVDDQSRRITAAGSASYTTSIASNFTVLCLVNLRAKTNSAGTSHALVGNNAGVTSSNYFLNVSEPGRKLSCFITNGTASQNVVSTAIVPTGWCWVGYAYQAGTAVKTIVNTTVESTAPTVTHTMDAGRTLSISSTNSGTWVHGRVARIWIFGGQITTPELNAVVYSGEIPSSLTRGLIWNMTDGSGTTVTDTSGNGNTGTLTAIGPSWQSTGNPSVSRTLSTSRTLSANRTTV